MPEGSASLPDIALTKAVPKIWGYHCPFGKYVWAVIKPRLGSDKSGFHSLQSEETDIVILKLNKECSI